jgi:hypothetical protein
MEINTLERLAALLAEEELTPERKDGDLIVRIKCGTLAARIEIDENQGILRLFAFLLFAPEARRCAMAETVCRINWGLRVGRFEMDTDDGEVRFYNWLPVLGATITVEQLRFFIFASWSVLEEYTSALAEVAIADAEPAVAIAKAEMERQNRAR